MKKFSVLFAVMAILVAVGSAFTTKNLRFTTKYERFGITNDAVTTASGQQVAAYNNQIADPFRIQNSTTSMSSITTEISNYNFANPSNNVTCNDDLDQLCAVVISYPDSYSEQNVSLVSYVGGDYSRVP